LWLNGWMDQDATWYGSRPWPRLHCMRWGLSSPQKGGTAACTFWPMSIVANSASTELLFYFLCFVFYSVRFWALGRWERV